VLAGRVVGAARSPGRSRTNARARVATIENAYAIAKGVEPPEYIYNTIIYLLYIKSTLRDHQKKENILYIKSTLRDHQKKENKLENSTIIRNIWPSN
jgi:hypothetical protein